MDRRGYGPRSIKNSIQEFEGCEIQELLINQTDLYMDGVLTDPVTAYDRQKDFVDRLNDILNKFPDARLGYFALAHIPLIFHLGYETNIREVDVFASHRQTRKWQALSRDKASWQEIIVDNIPTQIITDVEDIVLIMSISYQVLIEQIEGALDISSMPLLYIKLNHPSPDLVKYEEQLERYAQAFHRVIAEIRKFFPNAKRIHLFYSGPPILAFRCGQQISKTVDPNLIVYNFSNKDTPNYGWALNIHSGEVIDLRKPSILENTYVRST